MKRILLFLLLTSPLLGQTNTDFPDVSGWSLLGEVRTYTADNLWEYIDGAADQFLDYDFQLLRSADLKKDSVVVTVDIYAMGSRLDAFGIYTSERPTDNAILPFGTESVLVLPYQALLLKDVYYVKIDLLEGELTPEIGKHLLNGLANSLPGTKELPEELALLPLNGRVPKSIKFIHKGFLGLKELSYVLLATYRIGENQQFQGLVFVFPSEEAGTTFKEVVNQKWEPIMLQGTKGYGRQVPYSGWIGVVYANGRWIGVSGVPSSEELANRLAWFAKQFH